jgi:hypothetical protein
LLDLFCGAIDALNKLCYDEPKYQGGLSWEKSFARIVDWKFMQSGRKERSFVPIAVAKDSQRGYQIREIAESAENHSLLTGEIKIVAIALKSAARKHIRKTHCAFMNHIQIFTINTMRRASLKILAHGERSIATNGLRQSACLAGSV